jgi:hypothetical protein
MRQLSVAGGDYFTTSTLSHRIRHAFLQVSFPLTGFGRVYELKNRCEGKTNARHNMKPKTLFTSISLL